MFELDLLSVNCPPIKHHNLDQSISYLPCFSLLPRTALAAMLRGNFEEGWLSHFGLKCSSNVAVNAGTSGRSVCCAIGNTECKSVRDSNCLGSRIFECITNDYKHVFFDLLKLVYCVSRVCPHLLYKSEIQRGTYPLPKDNSLDDGCRLPQRMHRAGATLFKLFRILSTMEGFHANVAPPWRLRNCCSFEHPLSQVSAQMQSPTIACLSVMLISE